MEWQSRNESTQFLRAVCEFRLILLAANVIAASEFLNHSPMIINRACFPPSSFLSCAASEMSEVRGFEVPGVPEKVQRVLASDLSSGLVLGLLRAVELPLSQSNATDRRR